MTAHYYTFGPLDIFLDDREAENFNYLSDLYVTRGIRFSPSNTKPLEGVVPPQYIKDFKYVCVLLSILTDQLQDHTELDAFTGYKLSKKR